MQNRIIKFRAWDKRLNVMIYAPNDNIFFPALSRKREIMQFTGLHDKNDKEIYEGDIISSDNFSSNLVIGYSNEKAAFVGSRTNSFKISEIYNFLDDIVIDDNWEVIGNIYENPDLL